MTAAIKIIDVSKKYGYMWALKPFSLNIEEQETVAFLGPNGAGKSTLLKILATQIRPSSGIVKIYGQDAFKEAELVRKRVGFVAHESFLYAELSVEENLKFYGQFFHMNQERLQEVIEVLNLKSWLKVPVKRLSYGLRKRADIARALIHDPDLILLDELFSGLDEDTCNLLVDYFRKQEKKTILISSHSIEWAKKLCERGIILNRGEIIQDTRFQVSR
jgi:ABC-type multidrug transport system ATPase subunit